MSKNLTFNIITFKHPEEEYTFYFTKDETEDLCRVHHNLVPDEVIKEFGEQEHYYTSYDKLTDGFLSVTKKSRPVYIQSDNGDEKRIKEENSAFSISILKRYYNLKIHNYFRYKGFLVKPNFIDDNEIWLPVKRSSQEYTFYEKYTVKVQIARISKQPELLITYAGQSKVFKISVAALSGEVSPLCFNWVIYEGNLYKYDEIPDEAARQLEKVFPVWNFDIRDALNQATEPPERGNKYIKFQNHINDFFSTYLNTDEFKAIIPIDCEKFFKVTPFKVGSVKENSNQLLFGNKKTHIVPIRGMQLHGPLELSPFKKIHFFYIFHKDDFETTTKLDVFFNKGLHSFKGLLEFSKVPYYTERGFSIRFENKTNPLPEIEEQLRNKNFKDELQYIAIYISPFGKHITNRGSKSIYYRIKELLLKYGVTSQAIEAAKVNETKDYVFSLNNIAIAILAKLNGVPWRLDTKPRNELIVGIGAFRHIDTDVQYIGSAFSFSNNGKFHRFECFMKNQTEILAGSILNAVKDYVAVQSNLNRLVIHFYKNISDKELAPIEEGLNDLGLDIPVFIVSINKTESHDIVAFDDEWTKRMPYSGTYINIGARRYLLFNNTRYNNESFKDSDGFPFPIKLHITCTHKELEDDFSIIKELIDQVYQFSRMYWKSVRQQNLPVTIKYPEMVAEMFPHFEGNEIPVFGRDNLWFL